MAPEQVEQILARIVTLNENITIMTAQINQIHTELAALTHELANAARAAVYQPPA